MSRLRVHSFSISIDSVGAGPNQDLSESARSWRLKVFDWFRFLMKELATRLRRWF